MTGSIEVNCKQRCRRRSGYATIEMAAALVFVFPLVFLLLFAAVEVCRAYMINTVLSQAANKAARQIAILYPDVPAISSSRATQDLFVYDWINYGGIVQSSLQFDDAVFNANADPQTVSVTVHYTSGQNGLPQFPSYDPIGLGNKFNFYGTSVYRLESN